jgi:hypothetical protein
MNYTEIGHNRHSMGKINNIKMFTVGCMLKCDMFSAIPQTQSGVAPMVVATYFANFSRQ